MHFFHRSRSYSPSTIKNPTSSRRRTTAATRTNTNTNDYNYNHTMFEEGQPIQSQSPPALNIPLNMELVSSSSCPPSSTASSTCSSKELNECKDLLLHTLYHMDYDFECFLDQSNQQQQQQGNEDVITRTTTPTTPSSSRRSLRSRVVRTFQRMTRTRQTRALWIKANQTILPTQVSSFYHQYNEIRWTISQTNLKSFILINVHRNKS